MKESIVLARRIAKECFRVDEPEHGDIMFDTKLCAKILEQKITSENSDERKQDGCRPLQEGYQPKEGRGHQQQNVTPPKGGTGEVNNQNNNLA